MFGAILLVTTIAGLYPLSCFSAECQGRDVFRAVCSGARPDEKPAVTGSRVTIPSMLG